VLLDRLESAVEGVVDGVFRTVLRGKIQPLEIARQLTRQAEEEKVISLSRVYVPNHFTVGLHADEMSGLEAVAPELEADLQSYVGEWVAEHEYSVSGPIRVELRPQERVARSRFRVATAFEMGSQAEEESPTVVCQSKPEDAVGRLEGIEGPDRGRRYLLFPSRRVILGRASECDLQLQDPLASRHHAALEQTEAGWRLTDLDSTNGTRINGQLADQADLQDGDIIQLGESVFRACLS
jgi:hypothetical protein